MSRRGRPRADGRRHPGGKLVQDAVAMPVGAPPSAERLARGHVEAVVGDGGEVLRYRVALPIGGLRLADGQVRAAERLHELLTARLPGLRCLGDDVGVGGSELDGAQASAAGLRFAAAQRDLATALRAAGLRHGRLVVRVCGELAQPVAAIWQDCGYPSRVLAERALMGCLARVQKALDL